MLVHFKDKHFQNHTKAWYWGNFFLQWLFENTNPLTRVCIRTKKTSVNKYLFYKSHLNPNWQMLILLPIHFYRIIKSPFICLLFPNVVLSMWSVCSSFLLFLPFCAPYFPLCQVPNVGMQFPGSPKSPEVEPPLVFPPYPPTIFQHLLWNFEDLFLWAMSLSSFQLSHIW